MLEKTMFKPVMKAIAAGVCAASLSGCFQAQTFGPMAGATLTVEPLRDQGNVIYEGETWDRDFIIATFGQEAWDDYSSLVRLVLMGMIVVQILLNIPLAFIGALVLTYFMVGKVSIATLVGLITLAFRVTDVIGGGLG